MELSYLLVITLWGDCRGFGHGLWTWQLANFRVLYQLVQGGSSNLSKHWWPLPWPSWAMEGEVSWKQTGRKAGWQIKSKTLLCSISKTSLAGHQCFNRLLDPPWTSWGQLAQSHKVSKLLCPQAMSKSSTISSQSDDQQAGKSNKFGKSIW